MNELHIVSAVSLFATLAVVVSVTNYFAVRNLQKLRSEYLALQALKPKLEKYNMRLHEVSEGLYQVVQYAKTSDKPVFQLAKGRKRLQYIKLDSKGLCNSKSTLMTASYLNNLMV